MRHRTRYLAVLALVLAGLPALAQAEARVRAVLVGVSDYLHIDADLRGPRNDVVLMREALLARGVAPGAIRILSQDAEPPTRAAILAALDRLAAESGPGDTALFYFSGHGTQAPDRDGDEMGGLDEVFLPADARGWSPGAGAVENGITDDEFRDRAAAIMARGARLVAVLDACHSATGFRALGGQGVARIVAPAALGIPDATGPGADTAPAPLDGAFGFLYAAQSDERAFEYPQGDAAEAGNWHGEFTRVLAQTLREVPDLTWGQAMQAVRAGMRQGATIQTPDAEGPMLAAAVFGSASPPPPRVRFAGLGLGAGRLDGFEAGAQLALYPDATAVAAVARAEIVAASARGATLRVIAGAAPPEGFAVQSAPGLPPPVRIGAPERADGADYAGIAGEMDRLSKGGAIEAAEFGAAPFDIGLVLTGGMAALTGPDGVLDPLGPGSSPRLDAAGLAAGLERAARVHRLRAALGRAGRPGAATLLSGVSGLRIEARHRAGRAAGGRCRDGTGPETPARDAQPVAPCDQVWLHLRNLSRTARDVTVLYIDAANAVTALWPPAGTSNRLGFDETARIGVQIVAGAAARGREELIVIAVPAEPGAPRADLSGLADPAPARALAGAPAAAAWLLAAADPGTASRGFAVTTPVDAVEVTRISLFYQSHAME